MQPEEQMGFSTSLQRDMVDRVWYEGKHAFKKGYHDVSKAMYIQFKSGLVLKFHSEKKDRRTPGHYLAIEEIKQWEKQKKYLSDFKEVGMHADYRTFTENPIIGCQLEIGNVGESIIAPFTRLMNHLYKQYLIQNIQLQVDDVHILCISTSKVIDEEKMVNFYNQLTVFFQKKVYRTFGEKQTQTLAW